VARQCPLARLRCTYSSLLLRNRRLGSKVTLLEHLPFRAEREPADAYLCSRRFSPLPRTCRAPGVALQPVRAACRLTAAATTFSLPAISGESRSLVVRRRPTVPWIRAGMQELYRTAEPVVAIQPGYNSAKPGYRQNQIRFASQHDGCYRLGILQNVCHSANRWWWRWS